jgi:hypothetical protein
VPNKGNKTMTKEPVLASTGILYYGKAARLIVHGGLHYLRGNRQPYFGITGEVWFADRRYKDCQECGCIHERILKHFPQFADLIAMHLSDIDGAPMHDSANGWYDLAGALPGNAGERYHVGNSQQHFPKPAGAPRKGDGDNTDYRNPTPDECLEMFARYVRVSVETARLVRDSVVDRWIESRDRCEPSVSDDETDTLSWDKASWTHARAWFGRWIDEQRPRWKAEADACIAKHGLVVYGDKWPSVESEVA